jgi:tripartite-type tricarboxylate transporter receptor subunit TctC
MAVLLAMTLPVPAFAQVRDNRIMIIVGAASGGALDKVARTVARRWSEQGGVPVVVDNKAGANGMIAADFVAKSVPDGRTILFDQSSMLLHTFMRQKVPFNPADMVPLTKLVILPHVLVVNAQLPYKTAAEFLAAARASPGKFNFSTPGMGSSQQLVVEQFARGVGIKLEHVPYKGGAPAMLAAATGEVQVSAVTLATTRPFIESGKVRALAVDAPERVEALPNVPTYGELGIKDISRVWFGAFLPPGTPAAVVKQMNEGIVGALKDPGVMEAIRKDGFQLVANTPEEFAAENVLETKAGEKLVRELNIRID